MDTDLQESREAVLQAVGSEPFDLAVVLGSGLGALAEQVDSAVSIPYRDLACFPPATVAGHAGRLVSGTLQGWRVALFQGRHHLYEGYSARQVTVSVRLAHALGCRRLLLTNAVGGINSDYSPGDFMCIGDHINLMGDNPLCGESRNPFVDLTHLYRQSLYPPLQEYAREEGIVLHRGILAALSGPSYETPAEVRMLQRLGADAVSMSTVPEAIMGKYLGMDVAGLSFVSNVAAGLSSHPLTHEEVLEAGNRGGGHLAMLVRRAILLWQEEESPSEEQA